MPAYNYKPMSPQEFARSLDDLKELSSNGLTLSQFTRLIGVDYDEVRDHWLNGTKPIPHHVRIFFAIAQLPGALSIARQLTDAVIEKGEDFDSRSKRTFGSGEESAERQVQVERSRRATPPRR